ncbi:hypothetical protein C359_06669 [Cryptococcus neoformans Bt120]|nr:hypothetical protein C359_06669 [Cryptococcus neoformans var. grubii Bt120]
MASFLFTQSPLRYPSLNTSFKLHFIDSSFGI